MLARAGVGPHRLPRHHGLKIGPREQRAQPLRQRGRRLLCKACRVVAGELAHEGRDGEVLFVNKMYLNVSEHPAKKF